MGLFDKLFKKEELPEFDDETIVSVCDGKLIPNKDIADAMFADSVMGKTIGIEPESGDIVSPANGTIEMMFPTGHAFGLRMNDGTGLLIHIGIDTVSLNGNGFKVFKKQGDTVKAGEKIVSMDISKVKSQGLHTTTMVIVTEPVDGKSYNFIEPQKVTKYQSILKK